MVVMAESTKSVQESLADTVKQVHAQLRNELKTGVKDVDTQWSEHLTDTATLTTYAQAMCRLATGPWANKQGECNRILWCVERCDEYFKGDVLKNLLLKDLRRKAHSMPTLVPVEVLPDTERGVVSLVETIRSRQWALLDVGSCYNSFTQFPQFEVTAIDIAPANEAVHKCDFLNVSITPHRDRHKAGPLTELDADSFDIVVFSLLLSYFPTPNQRLKCCVNAHKLLNSHGLLLIITPDSSHQNRHAALMKSWKSTVEGIGFHRWKYEKNTHLHCMAFRKTSCSSGDVNAEGLAIPQDNRDLEESVAYCRDVGDWEELKELPFGLMDSDSDTQ